MTLSREIELTLQMRRKAYAPYSGFLVGAGLLGASGRFYLGCNIENAAYTPTCCAERTAFFKAVSEGERGFTNIVIAGGKEEEPEDYCPPCGVCRQVMAEFCGPEFQIILARAPGAYKVLTLGELLPHSFGPGTIR